MHDVGIEILGQGALRLTGFLRELMQQRSINFESLYTVRTIKEVWIDTPEVISYCSHSATDGDLWWVGHLHNLPSKSIVPSSRDSCKCIPHV